MTLTRYLIVGACIASAALAALVAHSAPQTQDKYALSVPNGLAFSEFRGYESWETVAVSHTDKVVAVIVGNPTIIAAYKSGAPANGKPFPSGSKMAKIHWAPKESETFPGRFVPGQLIDVDFMVKDDARFADSGGWGYAVFKFDAAAQSFRPGTTADTPPQSNDAKCGFACHTVVKSRDYVFTNYGRR